MNFALVVVANGRGELLDETMAGIERHVTPEPAHRLIVDDSGDGAYLEGRFADVEVDAHRHLGHGPAIRHAWQRAAALPVDWILWMEEDMLFRRDVDMRDVARIITEEKLAQMVFKRQSHFPAEVEAGPTMIDRFPPDRFTDRRTLGRDWLRHRLFYSLNPHLVSTRFLRRHRWPAIPNSEHHFSRALFRDPREVVGLWGGRSEEPLVWHAGTVRTGSGY